MNNFRICDIPSNNLFKPCFKKFISLCCPHSNFGSVVLNEVSPCNHELSVMIIIVVIIVIIVISVSTLSVLCSEYSLRDGDFKFCRYLWSQKMHIKLYPNTCYKVLSRNDILVFLQIHITLHKIKIEIV